MIVNLKSAKARLSDFVEKASTGEEIWITVRGKAKARLCPLQSDLSDTEKSTWLQSVRETRAQYGNSQGVSDSQALWDDLREE